MLPKCSLSPFPPMVGTAWILHSAVGTWHADALQGLFLWAWALVSPVADSRQAPLIQAAVLGPGSSGKERWTVGHSCSLYNNKVMFVTTSGIGGKITAG